MSDLVYYNISLKNEDTLYNKEKKTYLQYTENRASNIINDISKYYFSIVRFQVQNADLPLFIPQIELGQTDINKTVYKITIYAESGLDKIITPSTTIQYTPKTYYENKQVQQPLTEQDIGNPYYYCYTYNEFLEDINTALRTAFELTQSEDTAEPPNLNDDFYSNTHPPKFIYNPNTRKFEFHIPKRTVDNFPSLKIIMNSHLKELFNGFIYDDLGGDLETNNVFAMDDWAYELKLNTTLLDERNNYVKNGVEYYVLQQERIDNFNWSAIENITFSSIIPIKNEIVGTNENTSSNKTQNIITDIVLSGEAQDWISSPTLYIPSAEYRFADMSQQSLDLKHINISVFWKSRLSDTLYPVILRVGGSMNIKILFKRK